MTTTAIQTEPINLRRVAVQAVGYYVVDQRNPAGAAPLLIGLHGYGQSAPEFLPLTRKLIDPAVAVASAQGFNQLWHPGTKKISFSWLTSYEKPDTIDRNNRYLNSIIDELVSESVADPRQIYLLGFSQGSSVAYRFAQANPGRVKGIISICADLPPDLESNLTPLRDTAVFIAYGLRDPIFPQEKPIHAAAVMRAAGIDVEILSFDRGHLIPSSIAPRVQEWMRRHIELKVWNSAAK